MSWRTRVTKKKEEKEEMSKVLEQTVTFHKDTEQKQSSSEVLSQYDDLAVCKTNEEEEENEDTGGAVEEKEKEKKSEVSTKYDFRSGGIPKGVELVNGDAQLALQYQSDGSSYVKLEAGAFLLFKELGLGANGGSMINDYTIIMDVMFDTLPKDSLALFQTNWGQRKGDGDAFLFNTGGVGIFGEHGVKDHWVKEKKWTRIVITMGGVWGTGTGRKMMIYVNAELTTSIAKGVFESPDGRFALSNNDFALFASSKDTLMPGAKIKYLEIKPRCLTQQQVKEMAYENRIYSFWEVELRKKELERLAQYSLQALYKRPPPVWMHPTYLAMFGDAYLEGTGLAGGDISTSLACFSLVLEQSLDNQKFLLNKLSHVELQSVHYLSQVIQKSKDLSRKFALAQKNPAQMIHFIRKFNVELNQIKVGEFYVVPAGIGDHPIVYVLEKTSENTWRFVIANTSPFHGLDYHPVSAQFPPKLKYKTCIGFDGISESKILDEAFWLMIFKGVNEQSKFDTPEKIYELLIPFLLEKPFEESIVEPYDDPCFEFRSPQRSSTAYFRCIWESFFYMLRRKELSSDFAKIVLLALRIEMLDMVNNDLNFVSAVSNSDIRLIKMACEQCAYTVVKRTAYKQPKNIEGYLEYSEAIDESSNSKLSAVELKAVKDKIDEIEGQIGTLPRQDLNTSGPPSFLELDEHKSAGKNDQWSDHPFFDRLLRKDEVDGLAGLPLRLPKFVPIDMLQIPRRVDSLEDAVAAIRYCDKLCTLISVQSYCVRNISFLKCALIEHTFVHVVPLPKPIFSEKGAHCIWRNEMRYALQLDILILLQRIMEHFASSSLSLRPTRPFDAVRIIVPGCIASIADAVMRKKATDIPSEVCLHLMGYGERGPPFGLSTGKFASQSETMEVHTPELHIARTSVLDYFKDQQNFIPEHHQIFMWELAQRSEGSTNTFIAHICAELAFPTNNIAAYISGEQYLIFKNYPEFLCYRDIAFYFKYFMNTEAEAFPSPGPDYIQKQAELKWQLTPSEDYFVSAFGIEVYCRPRKPGASFDHRYPSLANPSFLTKPHAVKTEDDVLHIQVLPSFEDVMGQKDSELLISYLTVPYLRIPLILGFFSTQDRIHCLRNPLLQSVLDSVIFEPGRCLEMQLSGEFHEICPLEVPTNKPELLATPYGLLLNELQRSPSGIIDSILRLITLSLELDTGTVFSGAMADIIFYCIRLASRVQNFLSFLINYAKKTPRTSDIPHLRSVVIHPEVLELLLKGQEKLNSFLRGSVRSLLRDWYIEAIRNSADAAASGNQTIDSFGDSSEERSDKKIDINTKTACEVHAHLLLLYRNYEGSELSDSVVRDMVSSFIFLTTRHTWNLKLLKIPETEMFEVLQVVRRNIIRYLRRLSPYSLSRILQASVHICTDTIGPSGQIQISPSTWAYIVGERCVGRFTSISQVDPYAKLKLQRSHSINIETSIEEGTDYFSNESVQMAYNEKDCGAEIDLMTAQLTLRSQHLKALDKKIASNPDVVLVFGTSETMQAATIESAEHRECVRLVGRNHDLHYWKTPDPRPEIQVLDRDYNPGELEASEQWIVPLFEPVRLTYLTQPFTLQICLPEKPLDENAEVAYMIGIHPQKGGTWKEIFVFKSRKLVHIYNVISHGRRFYRSLEYTNDVRFTLRDMQPSINDRKFPWLTWERFGAGHPYAQYPDPTSVVIFRDLGHQKNRSMSKEQFIPARLLHGIVPSALLDHYLFWQDESDHLRGYPISTKEHRILYVELKDFKNVLATREAGVMAKIVRIPVESQATEAVFPLKDGFGGNSDTQTSLGDQQLILLDLLSAKPGSKLYSLSSVLSRIENLSYVLAWTKYPLSGSLDYSIDLVEIPRLNLSFQAKTGKDGVTRLFSVDHADVFISNVRSQLTTKLIEGIPHSLLLSNSTDEILILVPALDPVRPFIAAQPFSSELVLNRENGDWESAVCQDMKYFMYPVHVSLSFMFTPTLSSALYLMLLRFLYRDYEEVFRLSVSISTDTLFSREENFIFQTLAYCNNDLHPNAHACRLKISSVVLDSPVKCPWDITKEIAKYISKISHVSTRCRLTIEEEWSLIEQSIADVNDPRFDPEIYSEYEITLVKNRKSYMGSLLNGKDDAPCFCTPHLKSELGNWPSYTNYSALEGDSKSWEHLQVMFSCNNQISSDLLLRVISGFWKGIESTLGEELNLGFLFLYGLFTGTIKAKVGNNDNSRTVAIILTQLLSDCRSGSFLASILNILVRNPLICDKLPPFKDNRKQKQPLITAKGSANEPVAPLDELFASLIPCLLSFSTDLFFGHESDVRKYLPEPLKSVNVPKYNPDHKKWIVPELSDFSKELRVWPDVNELSGCEKSGMLSFGKNGFSSFAGFPLSSLNLDEYIVYLTRAEGNSSPVSEILPFDVSKHSQSKSEVAQMMITRLKNEMKEYASQQNNGKFPKLRGLLNDDIEFLTALDDASTLKRLEKVNALKISLNGLIDKLLGLREEDNQFISKAIPHIISLANVVELPVADQDDQNSSRSSDALARYAFVLNRYYGKESYLWLEYLIGSLLSSKDIFDLQKVNPYFSEGKIKEMFFAVEGILLHANRVGHINRCILESRAIISLLNEISSKDYNPVALRAGILQKSEELARNLTTARHYVDQSVADSQNALGYDPRFLVFEFTWNILLRKMQVVMVREFVNSVRTGNSMVKQMIMGAGKTTVVGPLLALMLGDGEHLVLQVVPPALLEFSRSIMRSTFSSIMYKRVYTLSFDRSSPANPAIYSKLFSASKKRGVVISTPTSVKSIMLKLIENMDAIVDEGHQKSLSIQKDVTELSKVLKLFRESVLIMDEVDLILHPLKSELNFPIGAKHDLDFNPLRWKLPVHILDAVFYSERGNISKSLGFRDSNRAKSILEELKVVIDEGYRIKALQRSPHIVLLNPAFYDSSMKPIIAKWILLWLETQHFIGISEENMHKYILYGAKDDEALAHDVNSLAPKFKKMLNLSRDWLRSFLPHVLKKIDRVSFGILSKEDCDRALKEDPNMPITRAKLAIPFVGKDVPSRSSEFAHPDVIIGLTILAYRYEGLRWSDFSDIAANLRSTLEKEMGPYKQRQSSLRYSAWVVEAGGCIRGTSKYVVSEENDQKLGDDSEKENEIVPLRLLKQSNQDQMQKLYKLLKFLPDAIHWYLTEFIFPTYMRHQQIKISESGQAIGGEMLFQRRIGFSGTPSDLLPLELGKCGYEKGSDGLMLSTLTDPAIVSFEKIGDNWSVESLLKHIGNGKYHALIDTGALITGKTNLEVAQFLLDHGLREFDGVVFLDEYDRKMILVRATRRVLKLEQCGISMNRRFAFYDQVHTTGMDIKHMLNATAVLTLGKDMTFRDYAQGAFRMRGIGKGQKIHLFVIPEVEELMIRELNEADIISRVTSSSENVKFLENVSAWLVINSMRSERIQFNQLCLQNTANVWRKNCFRELLNNHVSFKISEKLGDSYLLKCLDIFREPIDFSVEACVPSPVSFPELIQRKIDAHINFIITSKEREIVSTIQKSVESVLEDTLHMFDAEMVQEQEEEKEKQQEQEQEQEIEIEKYVDLAYSREQEAPTPWMFSTLSSLGELPQFYKACDFHLYKRDPITFPDYLYVSNNYFDKKWSGPRRIKNLIMVLEWVPSRKNLEIYDHEPKELSDVEFSSLLKTFNLFDREKLGAFTEKNLASVIRASIGFKAELNDIKKLLSDFGSNDEMNFEQFVAFLRSGRFREEQKNRKFVALSLAEAETIRRIMHVRMEKEIISGSDASMCLRCVPAENHVIDQSYRFSPAPANQVEVENQCFRFLDCDMYYTDSQVGVLVKSLQSTRERDRRIFFERVMGCRRRMRRKWEETPVSKVFTTSDEWKLLKQKALMQSIREVISEKGILFYDAFRMFDYNRDGLLSASELYGSIEWLGFDLDPLDVIEFMRTNDIDKDGNLNYREFLEIVRDPDANFDDIEKEHESSESSGKFGEFQRIEPKAVQEILQLEMQLAEEEKKIEEEELKNEKDKEAEIMMKIEAEEIEQDLMQQGGPNPKIDYDIGNVKYDFTTGRRPRGLTSRGDFAFQNSFGDKFTLVHVGGMLFVLIPFSSEKSPLNEYTITMDISFDSLPESGQIALIQTAKYNQDTSAFYVRSDGQVGVPGHYSMESNVPKIQPKRWYVVSVSVNLHENMVLIYVDGQLCSFFSSEDLVPNGKYSVSDQLCLFGSKTVSENLGGQIKSLLFDTRSRDQFEIQAIFEMINAEGAWICEGCTYNNSRHSKHCELCSKQKFVFDADLSWACPVCTFINTSGEMCSVCETPKP